jgi:hypothetical protein
MTALRLVIGAAGIAQRSLTPAGIGCCLIDGIALSDGRSRGERAPSRLVDGDGLKRRVR